MARKIIATLCICMALAFSATSASHAAEVYTDSISSTYLQYARDLIPNGQFNDDYVFFRSGQYEYTMVMGDIEYSGGTFSNNDTLQSYIFTVGSGYNSNYTYNTTTINSFSLAPGNKMVYSNLGGFPQLVERGSNYEVIQTILAVIVCLCVVIRTIFTSNRKR